MMVAKVGHLTLVVALLEKSVVWRVSTVGVLGRGGAADASGDVVGKVRGVADKYGWGCGGQWSALSQLISRESSWNPNAANPRSTARGLFQKMTSIHGAIESSAAGQAEWGLKYIKQRYGSPAAAWLSTTVI